MIIGSPLGCAAGVFRNRLLFHGTVTNLGSQGFTVLTHSRVPCNDVGISLSQAVIAAALSGSR
jgi:hydrogenase maturation protein HypF